MFVKNAFKTVFLVCSALIGAGFASGREVMEFFPAGRGFLSAVVSVAFISLFVYAILKSGGRIRQYPLYRIGVAMFSLCSLAVMIAASGELVPHGRILMAAATLITVICGIRGIENVSTILCPAMILFILLFGIKKTYAVCLADVSFSLRFDAVLYAGYNVISLPVLLKGRKKPGITALAIFAVMASLMVVVYSASSLYPEATMPFFEAVGGGYFVTAMMLAALYTTAVCSAFCVCDIMGGGGVTALIITAAALIFSSTGFGKLISGGYRTFGFAGILAVIYEIVLYFKLDFRKK